MNDRELLELAAKAAGIVPAPNPFDVGPNVGMAVIGWGDRAGREIGWNPLTRDGDALQLAVKLRLSINLDAHPVVGIENNRLPRVFICVMAEDDDPEAYAATRRAIVRAAAEIGKKKD